MFQRADRDGGGAEEDADAYLERAGVLPYLHDAVRLLLTRREQRPLEFLHQYFDSVVSGDNVVAREFAYVLSTARNRCAFAAQALVACEALAAEPAAVEDCLQLLQLLCPDFPRALVLAAWDVLSSTGEGVSLGELLTAVLLLLVHRETFGAVQRAFKALASAQAAASASSSGEGGGEGDGEDEGEGDGPAPSAEHWRWTRVRKGAVVRCLQAAGSAAAGSGGPVLDSVVDVCQSEPADEPVSFAGLCGVILRDAALARALTQRPKAPTVPPQLEHERERAAWALEPPVVASPIRAARDVATSRLGSPREEDPRGGRRGRRVRGSRR